ncbi:hypothetical protein [Paraglaciecola sp. L3A3]|uniref:hypothetical protein n=1 Tax=Paraglaciecola sp. L3A3 TaxID=2686358 RepID=UPI00131EC15D|nr:hypothetical protein [Paraglaciecola sp. L3A3]
MEQSSSRSRSLLEIAFNNQCKFNNQKKTEVAKVFCMSYPTLYRKLLPDSELPLSGEAVGYWLTIHNDPDPKSSGRFAMGDIYLKKK